MSDIIEEVLARPLADVLARVGEGIAQAQRALDLNSLATETLIANDESLRDSGLTATWYAMPEVRLELKMTLDMRRQVTTEGGRPVKARLGLLASPLNARSAVAFPADVSGASTLTARIVALPPPSRAEG